MAELQHLTALAKANRVRLDRAVLKRAIRAGEVSAVEVITDPPPEAVSWEILDLLMTQVRWGKARSRRVLVGLGIPENKPVGTLTVRQRRVLCALLAAPPGRGAVAAA